MEGWECSEEREVCAQLRPGGVHGKPRAICRPIVFDQAQPMLGEIAEELIHASEEAGERPDVLQVFGFKFRLDLRLIIVCFGWGVELEALGPLTPQLELQAPHVPRRVEGVAVARGEEGSVGVVGLLGGLARLVVKAGLDVAPAEGVASRLQPLSMERPFGLARADEAAEFLARPREGGHVATLPVDMDIGPRELGRGE